MDTEQERKDIQSELEQVLSILGKIDGQEYNEKILEQERELIEQE